MLKQKKLRIIFIALVTLVTFVFSNSSFAEKSSEEIMFHVRERHDINFMTPYQFVTAFKYLHRNDAAFTAQHGSVTIDDLVQFSSTKAKGVCFNQAQMSSDTGRNQVYKLIADIANMTDINDHWIDQKTRKIPPAILQINGKRGGYNSIGVWLDKNQNYGIATAFPDGFPDGNNVNSVGIGMIIGKSPYPDNSVKGYYIKNICNYLGRV